MESDNLHRLVEDRLAEEHRLSRDRERTRQAADDRRSRRRVGRALITVGRRLST